MPFLIADDAPLTLQHADALNELTTSPCGLTFPSIPTPDEGIKTPSDADIRTTCFNAQLLATFCRLVEVEVLLITNFFC
jgi:hypothetical protein